MPSTVPVRRLIAAYIPILALVGIEGKMFKPMGITVILALVGALLLSMTLIPALCAFFLRVRSERENPVVERLSHAYEPALKWAMSHRYATVGGALVFVVLCTSLFSRLGSEFIPELDEGAMAIQLGYPPSMSLEKAIEPFRHDPYRWTEVSPTLEDVFIHLMRDAAGGHTVDEAA